MAIPLLLADGLGWPCSVRSALKRTPMQDFNSFSIMFYYIITTTYQKVGDLFCPVHISGLSHCLSNTEMQFQKNESLWNKTTRPKNYIWLYVYNIFMYKFQILFHKKKCRILLKGLYWERTLRGRVSCCYSIQSYMHFSLF